MESVEKHCRLDALARGMLEKEPDSADVGGSLATARSKPTWT